MLKLGICTTGQDTPLARLWRRGMVAANILPTQPRFAPEDLDRLERIVSQLRLSNGTVRTTLHERLVAVDEGIAGVLLTLFPASTELLVEDWAVSTGITALEWFRSLRRLYPNLRFAASDWILYLIEVRPEQKRYAFIVEPGGNPIQYIRDPFVVSLTDPQHLLYFVNRIVQRRALREWDNIARHVHFPPEWGDGEGPQSIFLRPFSLRRIPLLHPHVLTMRSEHFRIKRHSVFSPLAQPVHVIRTMNVLNRSYFSDLQLLSAADAVRPSLIPGGLWIVGRTVQDNPPRHEVSVIQNSRDGWKTLFRIGKGSEIESNIGCSDREVLNA